MVSKLLCLFGVLVVLDEWFKKSQNLVAISLILIRVISKYNQWINQTLWVKQISETIWRLFGNWKMILSDTHFVRNLWGFIFSCLMIWPWGKADTIS